MSNGLNHAEVGTAATTDEQTKFRLTLTDLAIEKLKEALAREALGADYGLRLSVSGGGCSGFQYEMRFDNQVNGDDVAIENRGVRLIIDSASLTYLNGITLDYVSGLHGAGFRFLNPNAARTCGCGSSFSV
jgi:iron-sulfur cluster assembly accessory protein